MKAMTKKILLAITVAILAISVTVFAVACGKEEKHGDYAYDTLQFINDTFGGRASGSTMEKFAANWIKDTLNSFGYDNTEIIPFTYSDKNSQNVVAEKKADVNPDTAKTIIIGAHYDSSTAANGVDDNGSGVAVTLEAAKMAKELETEYNIKFVFFGSEEAGLQGSKAYANAMTEEEIANTALMINIDTIAAGDFTYVYASSSDRKNGNIINPQAEVVLNKVLDYSKENELGLITQQGLIPDKYPVGTTGSWSDHASFEKIGVPAIYFEATNWTIEESEGVYSDGYLQVELDGVGVEIMHTQFDTFDFIEGIFPGRIKSHLASYSKALEYLMTTSGDLY